MSVPVPILLSEGRWGLMWAEATPPPSHSGPWLDYRFTLLWFTSWTPDGWEAQQIGAQSDYHIDWSRDRTIRYSREQGVLIMVVAENGIGDPLVLFGSPEDRLRRVSLESGVHPYASTFVVDTTGQLFAVLQVRRPGLPQEDRSTELVTLTSADGGNTWSSAETIARLQEDANQLRLHLDGNGVLHLVWFERYGHFRHMWADTSAGEWIHGKVNDVPADAASIGGVSGIDRCGRLTIVREVLVAPSSMTLRASRWMSGHWRADSTLDSYFGTYLFDGVGHDGQWLIGWSGVQRRGPGDAPSSMEVWLAVP